MPMGHKELQHSMRRDTPTIRTKNSSQLIVETVEDVLLAIAKNRKNAASSRVNACRVLLQHYHAKGEAQVSVDGLKLVQSTLAKMKDNKPALKGKLP